MMAWWNWVVTALNRQESALSLALFRIACGTTITGELSLAYYSGAAHLFWQDVSGGGYRPKLTSAHWIFDLIGRPDNTNASVLFTVALVGSVMVTLGLGTNVAAAVTLIAIQALFTLSSGSGGGHDRMILISLFVLALSRSDATLSLWSRLRYGRWLSEEKARAWSRVLITWNLTLIYTSAGLVKLAAEWLPAGNFRAVYNALMTPHWSRGDFAWLWGPLFPLTQLGTALTVVWETTFLAVPLWLLLRARPRTGWKARLAGFDVRLVYLSIGVVMHTTLLVFANLGPFSAITMSWYFMLFHPDEWQAVGRRILDGAQQPQPSTTALK